MAKQAKKKAAAKPVEEKPVEEKVVACESIKTLSEIEAMSASEKDKFRHSGGTVISG